jgi:opacity protein-like surface antigen
MELSFYSWENLGVNFQSSFHQMKYMAVFNLRTRLKTDMKTKSPYDKCA